MWGIVEIMGHRMRAGALSDATIGNEPLTEYYAPAAIFAIRPCSQEEAIAAAEWWKRAEPVRQLSAAFDEAIDDVIDDPDDDYVRGGP